MILDQDNLARLPDTVQKPDYDREKCKIGIAHIGIGAFHRAHMASYTNDVLNMNGGGDWRIKGISLRNTKVRDQLNPQDGRYSLVEKDRAAEHCRIIGAVDSVLVAPEDPEAVLNLLSDPDIKIISLTVTEKGYCHDPATKRLNMADPDIEHDLAHPNQPRTAIGYIVASMKQRRASNIPAPTILCCDNLPSNGSTLRGLVLEFAGLIDPSLADWISEHVSFPNSLVDRIVPATTEKDIEEFAERFGYRDEGLVLTEPFRQWVIEDNFPLGRPAWHEAGAVMVKDVAVFEEAKLRLLNGSHTALGYLGNLAGYEYVHQVMENPDFKTYAQTLLVDEVIPTLKTPPGMNLVQYCEEILDRFANPALHYKTSQIASDGSQKLPQRLLNTIRDQLEGQQRHIEGLSLAIAGWMQYVRGIDEQGNPIDIQDPMADQLQEISDKSDGTADGLVSTYLNMSEIFGTDLKENEYFTSRVCFWLSNLIDHGSRETLSLFCRTEHY